MILNPKIKVIFFSKLDFDVESNRKHQMRPTSVLPNFDPTELQAFIKTAFSYKHSGEVSGWAVYCPAE